MYTREERMKDDDHVYYNGSGFQLKEVRVCRFLICAGRIYLTYS